MVLHLGDHDLVAGHEDEALGAGRQRGAVRRLRGGVAERVRHEVDGLGGVLGEHQLAVGGTDQAGDGRARGLVGVGGLLREQVRAAVHGRVVPLVEVPLGVEDRVGLLGRGPRVEVDQPVPAAHRARQDREVGPDLLDVEQSGHRGVQGGHALAAAFT